MLDAASKIFQFNHDLCSEIGKRHLQKNKTDAFAVAPASKKAGHTVARRWYVSTLFGK
jgi:hypothetical protein